MNKILILPLLILITSCGNQTKLKNEIDQLQTQNDSLKSELKKYENKYVFDNVKFKHYPIKGSQVKKGTKYYGEFVFVADVAVVIACFFHSIIVFSVLGVFLT